MRDIGNYNGNESVAKYLIFKNIFIIKYGEHIRNDFAKKYVLKH